MGVIEAVLAIIGLVLLVALAFGALGESSAEPPNEDRSAPYREGLHAAIRIQGAAQDLEQRLDAEAASHPDADAERSASQATERQ
jgi:hypothetical protein